MMQILWDLAFFKPSKGMDLNPNLASLDPGVEEETCLCFLTSPVQDLDEVTKDSALVAIFRNNGGFT